MSRTYIYIYFTFYSKDIKVPKIFPFDCLTSTLVFVLLSHYTLKESFDNLRKIHAASLLVGCLKYLVVSLLTQMRVCLI